MTRGTLRRSIDRLAKVNEHLDAAALADLQVGLPMVDEYLMGLLPTDLVVLGAVSGTGKTHALVECAKFNLAAGKKVLFIALEAEDEEIEMRLKYKIICNLYFADEERERGGPRMDFRPWRLGKLRGKLAKYEAEADRIFCERYLHLTTLYTQEGFWVEDFERLLLSLKDSPPDMVFLDHLHYFSTDESKNENQQLSRIIGKIRQLNLYYKIPFFVAAHTNKQHDCILPRQEDFMGTSNIYKQATVCVMLGPKPDGYHPKSGVAETLISVVKSRTGGMGNLCGEIYYSIPNQAYSLQWNLGRLTKGRSQFHKLEHDEIPEWASGCQQKASAPAESTY